MAKNNEGVAKPHQVARKLRNAEIQTSLDWVLWFFGFVAFSILVTLLWYGVSFPQHFKELGPWGDFLAGVLNPILTFFTFISVLATLGLQRKEIKLSIAEMSESTQALKDQSIALRRQQFESAFFEMLSMYNNTVSGFKVREGTVDFFGRQAFERIFNRWNNYHNRLLDESPGGGNDADLVFRKSFEGIKGVCGSELSQYFRFLYNFFRLIDEHSDIWGGDDGRASYHAKLIRSLLSDYELAMLYLNCKTEPGKNFVKYAEKYDIFDNLPEGKMFKNVWAQGPLEAHIR